MGTIALPTDTDASWSKLHRVDSQHLFPSNFQWSCSETSLTGEHSSIVSVGASPGCEPLPPNIWLTHWYCETVYLSEAAGPPQAPPPPATWLGLWPVIVPPARSRMKPGKACDVWSHRLFTLLAWSLVKRPLKGDQANNKITLGSPGSETSLTGEPNSIVSVGASLGRELLPSWEGSKWLTRWTSNCALKWSCRASKVWWKSFISTTTQQPAGGAVPS
jgi:hypothetical protein